MRARHEQRSECVHRCGLIVSLSLRIRVAVCRLFLFLISHLFLKAERQRMLCGYTGPGAACERWGYRRFRLAEHHNMVGIASAATAVVISYVAAGTRTIRVGAGGIMLPNHSPLVIAFHLQNMLRRTEK